MVRNRIHEFRLAKDMSQVQLADRLPDSPGNTILSLIETGRVLPTREMLDALCRIFDCTPIDLYDKDDLDLGAVSDEGGERGSQNGRLVSMRISNEIIDALKEVGYNDVSDWLRESKRKLLHDRDIRRMTQRITIG